MDKEKGFDVEKYLDSQTKEILNRVENSKKLYLEFGGKICHDFHAARVLPGYEPNTKIKILLKLKPQSEIVFCVSAKDIENNKIRGDFGITYETATLKSINDLKDFDLDISAIIINRFSGQEKALKFKRYLENIGVRVYLQKEIQGYPADVEKIVSKDGYGQNPYVETKKPIVIVTGAGPGSGKMSFCLSQLYLDSLKGIESNFSKFETFPIWNLQLKHPVNLAYEAATADIGDANMIDPYHLKQHQIPAINYNRDIENFPILKRILEKIGKTNYNSPTEMGVNQIKQGIINNEIIEKAAKQEIIRRYFRYNKERTLGLINNKAVDKVKSLMQELNITPEQRTTVKPSRQAAIEAEKQKEKGNKKFYCGSAIDIDGKIITGKNSELLHSESACIINTLKYLSNIPDDILLLPEAIIKNIKELKKRTIKKENPSLDVNEILIALAISTAINPSAQKCFNNLHLLKNCEMHTTHLPTKGDETGLRDLGINYTTDAELTPKIYLRS